MKFRFHGFLISIIINVVCSETKHSALFCPNARRNLNQFYKFVEKENKEEILTCGLFCLVSDVSSHWWCLLLHFILSEKLRRRISHLVLRIKPWPNRLARKPAKVENLGVLATLARHCVHLRWLRDLRVLANKLVNPFSYTTQVSTRDQLAATALASPYAQGFTFVDDIYLCGVCMTIQMKAIFCHTVRYTIEGGFSFLSLWMKSPVCGYSNESY